MTRARPAARRAIRRIGAVLALLALSPIALWIAIQRIPWLGPLCADTARSLLGPAVVGRLEDIAYGIDDWWTRRWRASDAPQAYWDVPAPAASPALSATGSPSASSAVPPAMLPAFHPVDPGPLHHAVSAKGDGVWVPIVDPVHPDRAASMFKTLLHPDIDRAWCTVAIVAVDLRRSRLHIVPGRQEPKATLPEAASIDRPGLIPAQDHPDLLAAFNGGFKTIHGTLGMAVGGVTLLPPQKWACTVAAYEHGALAIRTWTDLADTRAHMLWWRQTPTCLVELGTLGQGVASEGNINWGMSVDGNTIIRRSAIGLSRDANTLYIGMGHATSAATLAEAMRHVGAWDVAQLDVNAPYPKLLLFHARSPGSVDLQAEPLAPWMAYEPDEYVRRPSMRDFFYLTRVD